MILIKKKIFGKDGTEYTEKITTEPLPPKLVLEELNEAEIKFINNNIELSKELLLAQGLEKSEFIFQLDNLEMAVKAWHEKDLEKRFKIDINMYSDSLAVAWGKFLEEKIGMNWYVITDQYGTEMGLYHKCNNVTIFPFTSMLKALKNNDYNLISIITNKILTVIQNNEKRP